MAGNIKGITIEFRGDTTKLDKALRNVKQDSKSIDQQLREVNRSLKFNPNNVELLRQKFGLLNQKIDSTEREVKEFKAIEKQLSDRKVSEQSAEWQKVRRNIIEAESKLKHYKAELMKVKYANITKMGNAFKTAGSNMRMAGTYATIGAGVSIVAGKKLLDLNSTQQQAETKLVEIYKKRMGVDKKAAQSTMKVASELQKQGIIGDEVTLSGAQQLATFAKYPGTVNKLLPAMDNLLVQQKGYDATAEDATSMANLFGKAMSGQVGALKKVGISFTKDQEKILKFGTEEERAAVLAEVVTDNVGDMNKTFAETDEGKMAQLKNTLGDIGERLGHMLLPALSDLATWISENIMPKVEKLMSYLEAHPAFAKVAVGIVALLAVGGPLLIFLGSITSAVGTLFTAFGSIVKVVKTIGTAFTLLSGPVGIVIAIIAALIAIGILVYKNWDKIKAKAIELKKKVVKTFTELKNKVAAIWTAIKTKITAVWTAIKTAVSNAVGKVKQTISDKFNAVKTFISTVWNLIKTKIVNTVTSIKDSVSSKFNAIKDKLKAVATKIKDAITSPFKKAKDKIDSVVDKIKDFFPIDIGNILKNVKTPHFEVKWKEKDFGKLGTLRYPTGFDVSWYAQGGIFNAASLVGVGEAGPEAVVPLDKFWNKLDAIADSGPGIVINVYGSPNMSVSELAAEVERRLVSAQKRRTSAWQ